MKNNVKNSVFYIVIGFISLVCGLIVYLLFRPYAYISQFIFAIIPFKPVNPEGVDWIEFYMGDFLWAFSLSCFIYAIYLPDTKNALICSAVVVVAGLIYELMQYYEVISGTGDITDVLFYLLAAGAVNIINYLRRKKDEKKKDC